MSAGRVKAAVPTYPKDDIRDILFYISGDLKQDNILGIKFLLRDILTKPTLKKGCLKVFQTLQEKEYIKQDDPWLLVECLKTIHRKDLVEQCFRALCPDSTKKQQPTKLISQYRLKLFEISMALVSEKRQELIYLFGEIIPGLIQEELTTTLDVFIFLEEVCALRPCDTESLQSTLDKIGRTDLADVLKELPSDEGCQAVETENLSPHTRTGSSKSAKSIETKRMLKGAEIKNRFHQSLAGKTCKVIYKKPQKLFATRYIFEVKGGDALKDLIEFKIYLNEDPGTWSGISSPMLDTKSEGVKWEVCLWCREKDFMPKIPLPGTECTIKLKDVNIYYPQQPSSQKERHTIVNIECEAIDEDK